MIKDTTVALWVLVGTILVLGTYSTWITRAYLGAITERDAAKQDAIQAVVDARNERRAMSTRHTTPDLCVEAKVVTP